MKMMEREQTSPELMEYSYYPESSPQYSFATGLQFFAVIVYILSQGFTIPILPIGPSWAVWPRLDDFSTLFLFLVYLGSRRNTCPMNKTERFIFVVIIIAIVLSIPSMLFGKLMRPEFPKTLSYGAFQTFRIFEYIMVWFCIRGMTFSSKQFDKISYTVFFVVVFEVIIGMGNATGAIPLARLLAHLPYDGPWAVLKANATGAHRPLGSCGHSGTMVDRLVFLTAILFVSRKPSAIFRIPLIVAVAIVVFLSGSRAATIAWCLSLAILASKSIKQLIIMLVVISLFLTSFYMFASSFESEIVERATERVGTIVHREEDPTMAGRTIQWAGVLRYIASDPSVFVLGVGWGFGLVVLAPETGVVGGAHCMYLSPLLEVGVFGAIMFYMFLFHMYRLVRGKDALLSAIRAAFIGLLVAGITGAVFFPSPSAGSFLGFVGAVFGIGTATYRGRLLEEQLYSEYEPSEEEDFGYEYSV